MITIRESEEKDSSSIAEIYRYYVEETAISFEYEAPDAGEMESRRKDISAEFPFLVAEEHGSIKGYAYAHKFSGRKAYHKSVEVTIYLDRNETGKGYGAELYAELEKRLKALGITNLYAIIMYPGYGSVEFHEHMGYHRAGILHNCGDKFGKSWSVIYMEKFI